MSPIVQPIRRHPGSISLGFVLFCMVLVGLPLALVANWRSQVIREHAAARRLRELGGSAEYGHQYKLAYFLPSNCPRPIGVYGAKWNTYSFEGSGETAIDAEIVRLLTQLPNLRLLILNGERRASADFAPLAKLPQLEFLRLACGATDADVKPFLSQHNLANLELSQQPITDASLVLAQRNPNLTHLDLADTAVTDEGLRLLAGLTKLEFLHLERTRITSAGLQHLSALPQLQYLYLQGTAVDDSALLQLGKFPELQQLHLTKGQLTAEAMSQLERLLPGRLVESQE